MMRQYLCTLFAVSFTLLAACGGGGGNGGNEVLFEEQTLTLEVVRPLSGFLSENGFESADNDAFVGTIPDIGGFLEERGILTFDLTPIPAGATLLSAELQALQGAQTGTPYDQVVQVIVDHIVGLEQGVSELDFNSAPLSTILDPALADDPIEEFKNLDLTDQVAVDLTAGRTETKLRLRGQVIDPLTAGNQDNVDPVDLARFLTDAGETRLRVVVRVPVAQDPE